MSRAGAAALHVAQKITELRDAIDAAGPDLAAPYEHVGGAAWGLMVQLTPLGNELHALGGLWVRVAEADHESRLADAENRARTLVEDFNDPDPDSYTMHGAGIYPEEVTSGDFPVEGGGWTYCGALSSWDILPTVQYSVSPTIQRRRVFAVKRPACVAVEGPAGWRLMREVP